MAVSLPNKQSLSPRVLLGALTVVLLCLAIGIAGLTMTAPPWQLAIDVGNEHGFIAEGETPAYHSYQTFHASETWQQRTFRWTAERATVTVRHGLRMHPLVLEITACGCRPDNTTVPVSLALNNADATTLAMTAQWRTYHILVPQTLTHPDHSLMLDMHAPTWQDSYQRPLGIAIDTIRLRQPAPAPLADPLSVVVVLVGIVGVALWQRSLLPPVLLTAAWLVVTLGYQPQFLPRTAVGIIVTLGIVVLWWADPLCRSKQVFTTMGRAKPPSPHAPAPIKGEGEPPQGKDGKRAASVNERMLRREATPLPPLPFQGEGEEHLPGSPSPLDGIRGRGWGLPEGDCEGCHWRYAILVAWAGIGTWLVLSVQLLGHWIIDDGFISFRYAANFVNGYGLVFNQGEVVEGYTNFLWTMFMAAAIALGGSPVEVSAVTNMLLGFAVVSLTAAYARRMGLPHWGLFAAALVALSNPFLLYTTRNSGMETGLFATLILTTLVVLVWHRWKAAGILVALAMMTRPDGVLLAGVGAWYVVWQGRWQSLLRYAIPAAAIYTPYFLWRWSYYGYLLPNTFYAKVGGTWAQMMRGLEYTWAFGTDYLLLFAAVTGGIIGGFCWWRRYRQWGDIALIVLVTLLYSGYIVAVGGDWMHGARFFVALVPLMALVTMWGVAGLARYGKVWATVAGGAAALMLVLLILRLPNDSNYTAESYVRYENMKVRHYREMGRWIQMHTPPDTLIATGLAGAIPYYAERPAIDILGLTDAHIAHTPVQALGAGLPGHEKNNPDYVFSRCPQIIPREGATRITKHPDLDAYYTFVEYPGPEGGVVRVFVREGTVLLGTDIPGKIQP